MNDHDGNARDQKLAALVRDHLVAPDPAPDLESRIFRQIPAALDDRRSSQAAARSKRPWLIGAATVALAATVSVLIWRASESETPDDDQEIAEFLAATWDGALSEPTVSDEYYAGFFN